MTNRRGERRHPYRRAVVVSVLRSVLTTTVLVVLYYLAPLRLTLDLGTWLRFLAVLVLLAVLTARQVQAILRSDIPRVRAVEAVATGLPILLLVFAAIYVVIDANQPDSFNEALSRTDALYFTVTVFATVGFGDIVPLTELARVVTMLQMVTGLLAVGLVVRVVLGAAQVAVRRRNLPGPDATGRPPGPPRG
ncbi:potassium channel family protein [Pseudonocardia xinjiangensis]|uniref:Two pore domain potassium channel family protein n=1 Tax=Pseudonocardia xinjiangensis TaxID=75289 RepID=A0ABX1RMJ2_9PSEU|nr:potassium channel family protein [Pseudonocardia xinjiangensis]NMH81036.1 two pore domain potassium channel family protein [Pseudonocardia xinjiangensis]